MLWNSNIQLVFSTKNNSDINLEFSFQSLNFNGTSRNTWDGEKHNLPDGKIMFFTEIRVGWNLTDLWDD